MADFLVPLDVSELAAPEPMQAVMKSLSTLDQHNVLAVRHRREPKPLFSMLAEQAYNFIHVTNSLSEHRIYIWHADDQIAKQKLEAFLIYA